MRIFGWIMFGLIVAFTHFILILLTGPQIIAKIATFAYRTKAYIADERFRLNRKLTIEAEEKVNKKQEKKEKKALKLKEKEEKKKQKEVNLKIVEEQLNQPEEVEIEETKTITLDDIVPKEPILENPTSYGDKIKEQETLEEEIKEIKDEL